MGNDVWKLDISSQTQNVPIWFTEVSLSDDIICNIHNYLRYILLHIYNVEIVKLPVWGLSQRVTNLTITTIDPYITAY